TLHFLAQALIQLGDAVESIGDLSQQWIFRHRKTHVELAVTQIAHGVEHSSQIHVPDFSVAGEQIHLLLATSSGAGTVAVALPVTLAPVLATLSAGARRRDRSES